ncbi:outer membrane lipoprotein carrier protein LolA [Tatumella sp. UBA2305]|uniref:outer membrane lipoprotein carrier protein LolA n=1 Tax=Tatumella sp. UBA2305 TaxID=1947647 RepID=UPI0025E59AC8|nr:outer membrane lipoprotein carrier protein LolA [Tatumella sp. UBA2305]
MMLRFRILIIACLFFIPLANGMTVEQLQQQLLAQPVVRAHFEQVRTIKDMPQPLKSAGNMIMARGTGIFWQQQTPFPMLLILKQDRMVQKVNNQPAQVITAESNPQMFQFNQLLGALFTLDRTSLEKNFTLAFTSKSATEWQLVLTPTTTPLNKIFTRIILQGGQLIEKVRLYDKQGDNTDITFSQHKITPTQLTSEEHEEFETE